MSQQGAPWLQEALATRDLERVRPNMAAAGERINEARRHIRSARLLAEDDVTLAASACHDAIRKALTAHMAAAGLRVRGGEGAHRITLEYGRQVLSGVVAPQDLVEAENIRRDRAVAEYGDFATHHLAPHLVRAAADVAERVVNAIAAALATMQPPSR